MASINQREIAERLNVSVATVSKALRQSSDISLATRERVHEMADELGYKLPAKQNPYQETDHLFIGVVRRVNQSHSFFAHDSVLKDIRPVADALNTSLVSQEVLFKDDENKFFSSEQQPPAMRQGALAGYLLVGQWSSSFIRKIAAKAPCVLMPYFNPIAGVDQVGVDNGVSMSEIISHLHGLGHERIAFVGRASSLNWANERFAGYVSALLKAGLDYRESDVFDVDLKPMLEEGHERHWEKLAGRVRKAIDSGVTALVCSSDWPANQLHKRLAEQGIKIPDDVSIVGFDDTEIVTLGMPPVTSVQLPRQLVCGQALERLADRIRHPKQQAKRILLPCELIDHGTTSPPRA